MSTIKKFLIDIIEAWQEARLAYINSKKRG